MMLWRNKVRYFNQAFVVTKLRTVKLRTGQQGFRVMNKGLTPAEIAELVKLPEHLADDPFLQEVYGQVYRSIHEIFFWYRGFFSGKCRDLFPQSPKQKAEMALLLAGNDVNNLAMMAENARLDGKLEWALELADDVLLLEPKNSSARKTKNEAMLALAGETINAQVRNYLLSEYLLETNQIPPVQTYLMTGGNPKAIFASMDENAVRFMPMYAVFRIMAVNLNASKSVKEDLVVGLKLIDIKKHKKHGHKHKNSSTEPYQYSLHVRKGIFESQPQAPQKAEFKIITDSLTWKDLVLGKLSPKKAVKNKDVIIVKGKPKQFYDFMDLFN